MLILSRDCATAEFRPILVFCIWYEHYRRQTEDRKFYHKR